MDELLKRWREVYDAMQKDTAELRARFDVIHTAQREIEIPYEESLRKIEKEIKEKAIELGEGANAHGVSVSYRSGYERVSYDPKQTDMVLGILRDVLPKTAVALAGARKSSAVSPSVGVKAID